METSANTSNVNWNKSTQKNLPRKVNSLVGLIKVKKDSKEVPAATQNVSQSEEIKSVLKNDATKPVSNGLSLLGAYSDSENSNSDND